jgi:chromosome segregation ATPase
VQLRIRTEPSKRESLPGFSTDVQGEQAEVEAATLRRIADLTQLVREQSSKIVSIEAALAERDALIAALRRSASEEGLTSRSGEIESLWGQIREFAAAQMSIRAHAEALREKSADVSRLEARLSAANEPLQELAQSSGKCGNLAGSGADSRDFDDVFWYTRSIRRQLHLLIGIADGLSKACR